MSKVLEASCIAGVVKAGIIPVLTAEILSEGIGPSEGVLILDEDNATYITSNAEDIKTALGTISDALTQISTTLTSIGAFMTGPTTVPPPTLPTDIAQLVAKVVELTVLKETLK